MAFKLEILKNIILHSKRAGRDFPADIYFRKNNSKKAVIIFSHGFKSFKDWGTFNLVAESFAEEDFVFLKFNFPLSGTTPDHLDEITDTDAFRRNSYSMEMDNLSEVIDWLISSDMVPENEINKTEIYLLGHSRGAVVSLLHAARDARIRKLACWAPFSSLEDIWNYYGVNKWQNEGVVYTLDRLRGEWLPLDFSIYEDYLANKALLDIEQAVKTLKIPLMLTHGTEDSIIPFEESIKMKSWNTSIELSLMPLTNHILGGYHPYTARSLPYDTAVAVEENLNFFRGN